MKLRICAIGFIVMQGCMAIHSPVPEKRSGVSMDELFEKAHKGLRPQAKRVIGPKVVEIWASYCEACEATATKLEALYKRFGQCAQFMGLYVDEDAQKPLQFARKFNLSYPIGPDPDHLFSRILFLEQLPTIYFFDRKNELVFVQNGNDHSLSQKLEGLLRDCDLDS